MPPPLFFSSPLPPAPPPPPLDLFSRQYRRDLDTHSLLILIILINKRLFVGDLIQAVIHHHLASSVGVKDGTHTTRAVTQVPPKRFLGKNL